MNHLHAGIPAQALQERQRKLGRQAQQLPPSGSRPLTVSGRVSGWITAKATQALAGLPGVRVEDEAVHITAASGQRIILKAVLERVAHVLYDAGCARGWRDGHALPIERLGQPTRSPQHNEVTAESLDVGCNKNPNEAIRRKEGHAIGG